MPDLMGLWVKAPILKNSKVAIVSKCLKFVNPELYSEISRGKVVLEYCPEQEGNAVYGKIASMIRSTKPDKLYIYTIDGSPHCLTLQAAVNEAAYILKEKIHREHFVVLDGKDLVKISPESIRLARYLSIVEKVLRSNTDVLNELKEHSNEYKIALETGDADLNEKG